MRLMYIKKFNSFSSFFFTSICMYLDMYLTAVQQNQVLYPQRSGLLQKIKKTVSLYLMYIFVGMCLCKFIPRKSSPIFHSLSVLETFPSSFLTDQVYILSPHDSVQRIHEASNIKVRCSGRIHVECHIQEQRFPHLVCNPQPFTDLISYTVYLTLYSSHAIRHTKIYRCKLRRGRNGNALSDEGWQNRSPGHSSREPPVGKQDTKPRPTVCSQHFYCM